MIIHKELADGRWFKLSLMEQLANVGSDVIRAINWKKKGNLEASQAAFFRALELMTFTIMDKKNHRRCRLRELTRAREVMIDYFVYDNQYGSTDALWEQYFLGFNYIAALQRGR